MREAIRTYHITLYFPLVITGKSPNEQTDKLVEEYNEFRKELFSQSGPERMLHELQDLMQAYISLLMAKALELGMDERQAREHITELLEDANHAHRKKIERYNAERGWR